jgi:hypothetical protein
MSQKFACDVVSASSENKNETLLVAAVTRSQSRQRREVTTTSPHDNRDVVEVCPVCIPDAVSSKPDANNLTEETMSILRRR